MKKRKEGKYDYLVIAIIFVIFIMIISGDGNVKQPYINIKNLRIRNIFQFKRVFKEPSLTFELKDEGYDIFVPVGNGYRYGPSIMYYEDGTMDAWFASNGNSREWDWITYRHFDGEKWSDEEIALRPTKNSLDHYSTCDPGAICFNGYYYIGYTSTTNATGGGVENNIFVARSKNPEGPYEKWSGDGWGDDPIPIIEYNEHDLQWGAGEISFVIVNEKLYCYYTWICSDGYYMKLATADLSENWPETLKEKGVVLTRVNNQGSFDVVYNDTFEKFLAVGVEGNFNNDSSLALYVSDDGINFKQTDTIGPINNFAHNMGLSKKPNGHIDLGDDLVVGYAYSKYNRNIWGRWATRIQGIELKVTTK